MANKLIFLFILLAGCNSKRSANITLTNPGKQDIYYKCDSVKILSKQTAIMYLDGKETLLYANQIYVGQ